MTYVTCPTMRYHPAVVAQKAATMQLLSAGRFTLGVGSGENLNEHVVGEGWPMVDVRHAMLAEAITLIRELHTGDLVTWRATTSVWTPRASGTSPRAVSPSVSRSRGRSRSARSPRSGTTSSPSSRAPTCHLLEERTPVGRAGVEVDRPGPCLLGRRPRPCDEAGPRTVPVVRWGLGCERGPAHPGRLRGRLAVHHPGPSGRTDPVRSGPRRHRRRGPPLLGGGVHRHRDPAGRRRGTGRLPRGGAVAVLEALRSAAP